MKRIRVLIVDDSAFMRKVISDFVNDHPNLEVIEKARNGQDAIKKIKKFKPDVITLDIELPDMSGLDVLKQIMLESPTPTVVLSSLTKEGAKTTLEAMQLGAVDFVSKPSGSISLDLYKVKNELVNKIINAANAKIQQNKTKIEGFLEADRELRKNKPPFSKSKNKKIVCIGTSTGGPRALQAVLTQLPSELPFPILIVQHMPPHFTASLAERLNDLSAIRVKEAKDGELLQKGIAYIAPGGFHMKVKQIGRTTAIQLDSSPPVKGHRPSVNTLFSSLTSLPDYDIISIILTGMGNDGTEGLKQLKQFARTYAIAESQETAVIYGMPKSAIETKLVDEVVPLHDVANAIIRLI